MGSAIKTGALPPVTGYILSFVALAAAIGLRWLLDPLVGDMIPFTTLFGAVAAAIWLSGLRAALAVAIAGYIAANYLFIAPRYELSVPALTNAVSLLVYLFTCSLIIFFGEAMRSAQAREAESRELWRITLRSIGDGVITTGVDGRVTYLNAPAESVTGWSQPEAAGKPLSDVFRIVNETTRESVANPVERALGEGIVAGLANQTVLIRRDGTECPVDDSAAPIKDERGQVVGSVLIFRNVTAQRRLERERRTQLFAARRLASIVESSEVAIVAKSLDGKIQSWNAAAERLFGYSAAEIIGRHISLVIPPERLPEEDQIIATLKAGRHIDHLETERVRSDGRRVLVSLTVSPIKDDEGNVIGASKIVRDITRERETEAERRRLITLVDNSTDFIGICDLDGVPTFVNRAGLELVGLDSMEAARRTRVWDFFFPEDQARIRSELFPAVLEKGNAELEVRFRNFKTGVARWMAYKLFLIANGAQSIAIGTVSQDITQRKELDDNLRKLAAELSLNDKRKDDFLATLAHELRGPLAPLSNVLEVWKRSTSTERLVEARATMERQLGQMVRLVDDLLDVNRITHNRLELREARVALGAVVEQAVEACRPLVDASGHVLSVTLGDEPCYLRADVARLAQVFGNLLSNSCKYMDPGGQITLTAGQEGNQAVVRVKDHGMGIPADKLDSVFEMFTQVESSLERAQGGLGIGLTLVKRLVAMHGGTVEACSAGVAKGSEFVVRLPLDGSEPPSSAAASPEQRNVVPSRRILVVDDNTDAATSLAVLLELEGHKTLAVHDAFGAIDAAEKYRPDVVLLDIGLPRMSGHEVCRHLRERPWGKDLVMIALTGWGQTEDRRKSQEAGFDGHLVKPVSYMTLAAMLSSLSSQAINSA